MLNSTQKLAFNNYKAFIETAECSREIFKEVREIYIYSLSHDVSCDQFVAVEDHVHRLLRNIPKFSEACREFSTESQKVISKLVSEYYMYIIITGGFRIYMLRIE